MNDLSGMIVLASEAFARVTGYAVDEILGKNCRFLQGPKTQASKVVQIRQALCEWKPLQIELINYRKDGTEFRNNFTLVPLRDGSYEPMYFLGVQDCSHNLFDGF